MVATIFVRRSTDSTLAVGYGRAMPIKLHTCGVTFLHIDAHPCWKVQKSLDEAGIEYEQVKHPTYPRGRRKDVEKLSGQLLLPIIEFDDGHVLREETDALVARIKDGKLAESDAPAETGAAPPTA
jgi:hypothetical protein